ncbi:hypothetical protein Tco_0818302 [Tanacetum coccineum]
MDRGAANVPYLLVQYLFRHVEGRKSGARLSGGHFIRRLAHHFGLVSDDGLRGLSVVARELPLIDMGELVMLNICIEIGDYWAWAPQLPPPPPTAGRTMPPRLGRLKKEIQGLRRDVRSLCGLVESSMTDQGSSLAIFERRTRQRTGEASTFAPQLPPPPPTAGRTMPQILRRLKKEIQGLCKDVKRLRGLDLDGKEIDEVGEVSIIWNSVLIMEYLVKIDQKARILELKRRYFKDNCSDDQYAVSIKEDTAYLCLHSPKTTKETRSNTPYPEEVNTPYSSIMGIKYSMSACQDLRKK